jgi:hypothetical protein
MFINIFTILLMLTDHQLSLESSGRTHHILPKTGIMTEKLQTTTEFVTNLDSDDHRHQPLGDNNFQRFGWSIGFPFMASLPGLDIDNLISIMYETLYVIHSMWLKQQSPNHQHFQSKRSPVTLEFHDPFRQTLKLL